MIGSEDLDTGSVPGITGNAPGPLEGFRGSTGPGGLHGPRVGRDQPQSGLVLLPPRPKVQQKGRGGKL